MSKRIVIELELKDGGELNQLRPDMAEKYPEIDSFAPRLLVRDWVGWYLDAGGEPDWFNFLEVNNENIELNTHAENLRLVEVSPEGHRKVLWDWKATPQEPVVTPLSGFDDECVEMRTMRHDFYALAKLAGYPLHECSSLAASIEVMARKIKSSTNGP